jgi:hypothetical protein
MRARGPEVFAAHQVAKERFARRLKDAKDEALTDVYTPEAAEAAGVTFGEELGSAWAEAEAAGEMIDALDDPARLQAVVDRLLGEGAE